MTNNSESNTMKPIDGLPVLFLYREDIKGMGYEDSLSDEEFAQFAKDLGDELLRCPDEYYIVLDRVCRGHKLRYMF